MSWFAHGLIDHVRSELIIARAATHNGPRAVAIIDAQLHLLEAVKQACPAGSFVIVKCGGAVSSWHLGGSVQAYFDTMQFKHPKNDIDKKLEDAEYIIDEDGG